MSSCELVECECQDKGGVFWTDGVDDTCDSADGYGCIFDNREQICSDLVPDNKWCMIVPTELGNSDWEPDWPGGPNIGDAGQVVMPVESGSGIPGVVGGGPGGAELVETNTEDATGTFDPGQVFQVNELNSWFAPGAYGHGADFQMDAFLADAPLGYLEALLELQTLDLIRLDAPVAYYYVVNGGQDCNDNWVPDAVDIKDAASLDLNENGVPDECEQDDFADVDNPSPSNHADEPADKRDADESNSNDGTKAVTAKGSSSPCGSGVGLPVVMLSLCWMFVTTGRIGRRAAHPTHQRLNSTQIEKMNHA